MLRFTHIATILKGFCSLLLLMLLSTALQAADTKQPTAHQVVENTTQRVMTIIEEAKGYFDEDPERFYTEIETVLDEVVDFNSFARGVMGKYGSKKSYVALKTKAERAAFRARIKRFSTIFRDGLVQTYAKGLLAFNGNRIEVLPPMKGVDTERSATVVQQIYGEAEKPYSVQYKLRKNKKGDWKLRNVTIEAINLGKIYQGQFSSAVKQYQGDVDRAIDNWSVDPTADNAVAAQQENAVAASKEKAAASASPAKPEATNSQAANSQASNSQASDSEASNSQNKAAQ